MSAVGAGRPSNVAASACTRRAPSKGKRRARGAELLGHHGFLRIREHAGRRGIEQGREFGIRRRWLDGIAEADVDLHCNAGTVHGCREADADAALVRCPANRGGGHVARVKGDAVVNGNTAYVLQCWHNVVGIGAAVGGEVDVLGLAMERLVPESEEHGALENEAPAVRGAPKTEEESLDGVSPEEKLKVLAGPPAPSEQPRADGCSDVLERTRRHDRTAST